MRNEEGSIVVQENISHDDLEVVRKMALYGSLLVTVSGIYSAFNTGRGTVCTMICSTIFLAIFLYNFNFIQHLKMDGKKYIVVFIAYYLMQLIRGIFLIEDYSDVKFMLAAYIPSLIIWGAVFYGNNIIAIRTVFRVFLFVILPTSIIHYFQPFMYGYGDFVHTISPIYLMIIAIPYLKKKIVLAIILLAYISFTFNMNIRTNLLNIIIAVLIMMTYFVRKIKISTFFIRMGRYIFLFFPIFFVTIGAFSDFNIFQEIAYYQEYNTSTIAIGDSRTGVYNDIYEGLKKDNDFAFGLSASGAVHTFLFERNQYNFGEVYGKGRRNCEVSVLNYALWGGVFGCILFFLIFYKASYYAIYESNNFFSVMLGLFVSSKWLIAFLEDRISFNVYSFFLLFTIGMCFSKKLRSMSDDDIKSFFTQNLVAKNKKEDLHVDKKVHGAT